MRFLLWTAALLAGIVSMADEKLFTEPPRAAITKMDPAKVDGIFQDAELKFSTGMYGFCRLGAVQGVMKLFPAEARFHVGTDGRNIYIGVCCEVGPDGILARAAAGRDGTRAFLDDSFEFVFVPDPNAKIPSIYHIVTNNKGSYHTTARNGADNIAWEPKFFFRGVVQDGFWNYEAVFPLSEFGISELKDGQEIGLRVCRNWRRLSREFGDWGVQSEWNQNRGAFFSTDSIPIVVYYEKAPVVRFLGLKSGGKPDPRASLFNPTEEPMTLRIAYVHQPSNSQSVSREETVVLKAGETKTVSMPTAQVTENETISTSFIVSSADGKKTYYRRAFRWGLETPVIFASKSGDEQKIALKYAYYPETDKMFIRMDLSGIQDLSSVKKITARITDKKGNIVVRDTALPPLKNGVCEFLWSLPPLAEVTEKSNPSGEYKLTVMVDGIADAKLERNFERKLFDWEGNRIGTSDKLLPRFTPIRVRGDQVFTVLREHTMNGLGLWEQVCADKENLLKGGGMRIEAVVDGNPYPAEGGKLKFLRKSATGVAAKAEWNAGALKAGALSEWDYDGMMKYTLTLEPFAGQVDSLKLVIPLDPKNASLFHACTDGLRFNYGGAAPKGEGQVWNSRKAARSDLQSDYVNYIWLGAEGPGISVFGENDKGWTLDKKVPAQELIRRDGTLYLVYNLIAAPTKIQSPRTIVLGFQATPVKPMLPSWRKSALWSTPPAAIPYLDYHMVFLGSSLCQGGVSSSNCLFPRDEDVSLWEMYGQIRKTKDIPKNYLDRWCEGYRNKERMETYRREINYGLNCMKNAVPDSVTFYTNARGMRIDIPAARTFLDDWFREEFQGTRDRAPEYGAAKSYSIDPTRSFRDFAVTWYKKMLTTGACDNIYWDDIFLASNVDHAGRDGAYVMADGRLQPSVGLFNMRELIRRTAVMQLEIGRTPNNMVHMTNTAIAPICSFAQQNLDWEDNLGTNPFQQRYTKEYIRAVSLGRQFGNLPGALGLVVNKGDKTAIEWCLRTGAGVMLTHELLWTKGGTAKDYWNVKLKMLKFGYGSDDVRVWNYWEKGYPVRISGDTSSILLSKKDDAILIVCDYGDGGAFTAKPDLGKIGFSGKLSAIDLETGKPVKMQGDTLSFELKKYDFIAIQVKKE